VAKTRAGKTKRIKQVPISRLRREAVRVFSLYIRNRDGWKCTICGASKDSGAVIQNGHYVKRGKKAVTYDVVNCNAICAPCNYRDNIHHHHYERAIRNKWGNMAVDEMLSRADDIVYNERMVLEKVIKESK
jgi:hypothetical protein